MPTDEEMRIASGALEKESATWDAAAPQLSSIATTVSGLELTRTEAGMFQVMFDAYEKCRSTVESRAREGATEWGALADTLMQISKAYAKRDDETAEQIASTW